MLKGICILEVVIHHSLSHGARKFSTPNTPEWWILSVLNRILHFAIPLFLLASAVLLTSSLLRNPDWPRYTKRRFTRTLWPYLLWSMAYVGFRLAFLRIGSDTEWITRTYPLLGTVSGPRLLVNIPTFAADLAWGKAYFHLYFLVVLLQLAALLPFVILLVRGGKVSQSAAVLGAVVGQIVASLIQSQWLRVPYPASLVFWYVPSLVVGAWIGAHREAWTAAWPRARGSSPFGSGVARRIPHPPGRPPSAERASHHLGPRPATDLAPLVDVAVPTVSYGLARATGWLRADCFLFGQSFRTLEPVSALG